MLIRHIIPMLVVTVLASGGHAQTSDVACDDSKRLKKSLHQDLGAERQGMGLRDPDTALELWVTKATGEWVLVQHYANGTSCIVAMGEHWSEDKRGTV